MTVDRVRSFNDDYLQPPPQFRFSYLDPATGLPRSAVSTTTPAYYSTSADADLNVDGFIDSQEANPYNRFAANLTYQIVSRSRPVGVRQLLGLLRATVSPNGAFEKNDTLVSLDSARYIRFNEIFSFSGANGRNHQTVKKTDVTAFVLQKIRDAESQQPVD